MRLRFLFIAALAISALAAAPATAAPSAQRDDVWVGQVVRHHRHFDYRGSACPTSAEVCVKVLANYRIVPVTRQAAKALRRAAGGSARLVARRAPAPDHQHGAVLYVRRVDRA